MSHEFGFGVAIMHLKAGKKVARRGWRLKGMYLTVEPLGEHPVTGELVLPHISIHLPDTVTGGPYCYPHLPNQHDILADDWYVVEEDA